MRRSSSIIPSTLVTLGHLNTPAPLLCLLGFILIVALHARKIHGATLIGILVVGIIGIPLGLSKFTGIVSMPPSIAPTLLQMDFSRIFELSFIVVVFSILMIDVFDNAGTLIAVTEKGRLRRREGQSAAHEAGADLGQLRSDVRRLHRHLDHDELHRKRSRRRQQAAVPA